MWFISKSCQQLFWLKLFTKICLWNTKLQNCHRKCSPCLCNLEVKSKSVKAPVWYTSAERHGFVQRCLLKLYTAIDFTRNWLVAFWQDAKSGALLNRPKRRSMYTWEQPSFDALSAKIHTLVYSWIAQGETRDFYIAWCFEDFANLFGRK